MAVDIESFITWLRARGTPAPHLDAYRHYATELSAHRDPETAIRAAEADGAPAQRLVNLRRAAALMTEFQASRRPVQAFDVGRLEPEPPRPLAFAPKAELEPSVPRTADRFGPPAVAAPILDVEPTQRGRTPSPSARPRFEDRPPRRGCECRKRYDIYVDNDFGAFGKLLGGGAGISAFILIRMVGILGAAAVALGLAGLGGFVTSISICFRCEGCRLRISDLDGDERTDLWKARGLVVVITIGLLAGACVCAVLWWMAVNANAQH